MYFLFAVVVLLTILIISIKVKMSIGQKEKSIISFILWQKRAVNTADAVKLQLSVVTEDKLMEGGIHFFDGATDCLV